MLAQRPGGAGPETDGEGETEASTGASWHEVLAYSPGGAGPETRRCWPRDQKVLAERPGGAGPETKRCWPRDKHRAKRA